MITLMEHQIKALELTKDRKRVAYILSMGLGKTYVGSEKMKDLGNRLNVLICQKSKIKDWKDHFAEHYPDWLVVDYTANKHLSIDDIKAYSQHGTVVVIINYELAWRRKELTTLSNFTLMLDESSLIQNDKAKQTKFIMSLNVAAVILLSGTPCSGKYENLWSQARLLGWDIKKSVYEETYINFDTVQLNQRWLRLVSKKHPYKNIERLKSKLREHGAVFMLSEDVLTLPEQNFIDVKVEKSSDYKIFMKDNIVYLDDGPLVGDTTLTKLLYARMLCSIFSMNKLETFEDLLKSTGERLIVFYNFKGELEALRAIVEEIRGEGKLSVVSGSEKDLTAYENEVDSVTLVQYQAGAMGLNLQKANKIIYYSPTLRSDLFEQSKKRIHRIGQSRPCFYYRLIVKGSVEEQIYRTLEKREDYTTNLLLEGED